MMTQEDIGIGIDDDDTVVILVYISFIVDIGMGDVTERLGNS